MVNGTGGVVTHTYTADKACGGTDTINALVYTKMACVVRRVVVSRSHVVN